ncbi:toxin glutamine deamidase domain-containing protein [Streptomyces chattanoogensis]
MPHQQQPHQQQSSPNAQPHHQQTSTREEGAATPQNEQEDSNSLSAIRNDLNQDTGGLLPPHPRDQQLLENAHPRNPDGTPQRFADPFGSWAQLQNDGGNTVPGRNNNCADCSRSFLETWYGNPQVSAPRTPDTDEHGNPDTRTPENDANPNQIRWSGATHTYAGRGDNPDTAARIARDLQQAGHGAAAIVQVGWPKKLGGGGHAFNAVNHHGKIIWVDTQTGEVSTDPIHISNAEHAWYIPLDADRQPLHADHVVPKPDNTATDQNDTRPDESSTDQAQTNPDDTDRERARNRDTADATRYLEDALRHEQNPLIYRNTSHEARDTPSAAQEPHQHHPATDTTTSPPPPEPDPTPTANHPADQNVPDPAHHDRGEHNQNSDQDAPHRPAEDDSDTKHNESPTPVSDTRPYDVDGGVHRPDPADQGALEKSVPLSPHHGSSTPNQPMAGSPYQRPKPEPSTTDLRPNEAQRQNSGRQEPTLNSQSGERPNTRSQTDPKHTGPGGDPRTNNRTRPGNRPAASKAATTNQTTPESSRSKNPSAVPEREGRLNDEQTSTHSNVARADSASTRPPEGPPEPAGATPEEQAFVRKWVDFANESVENRKKYWRKDGQRWDLAERVEGRQLPQLKEDPDNPGKYIAAHEGPPPIPPDYMPTDTHPTIDRGRDDGLGQEHIDHLDAITEDRSWTLAADSITGAVKDQAKKNHGEASEEHKQARSVYADTHTAARDIGEYHGEYAALHHAMASEHPEYKLYEIPRTGNGSDQFDQIYEHKDKPGHFFVVEAKGPSATPSPRKGHSGRKVMQGTREYFETIIMAMAEGTPEQREAARKLKIAYALGNVQYALVTSKVEEVKPEGNEAAAGSNEGSNKNAKPLRKSERYGGFNMKYYDIRKQERRGNDDASTPS